MISEAEFRRLEYAIADMLEDEPINIDLAAARNGLGPVEGLILTEVHADRPGQGTGSRVVPIVLQMAGEVGLPVYLEPASDQAASFFRSCGFQTLPHREFGQTMRARA